MSAPARAGQLLLAFLLGAGLVGAIWAISAEVPPGSSPAPELSPPTDPRPAAQPDPTSEPPTEEDGSPPDEPEPGLTAVRYRCILPPGVTSDAPVSAWWCNRPGGSESYPARLRDGVLTIQVPPGSGEVTFHIRGCAVVEFDIEVEEGRVLDGGQVELSPCTPLSGRVVDAEGTPIHLVAVWPDVDGHTVPLTCTGRDGTFAFDGLPAGPAKLLVEGDGYVRRIIRFPLTAETGPIEIVLQRGGRVHGHVFDENGQPLSNGYYWIVDPEDEKNRERMAWPGVEDDGSFSVNLSPGRYRLSGIEGKQSGSVSFEIQEGTDVEVTLRLGRR